MRYAIALALFCAPRGATQAIDWSKTGEEGMRHFQSLVQIDSTGAPGTETKVAEYVKRVLEAEGISVTLVAKEPAYANVIARIKGNGSKKPLLIMGP
jgi:acetylornithine deacetylase/succinyl-diaminopimelate desuccinylase-like protein